MIAAAGIVFAVLCAAGCSASQSASAPASTTRAASAPASPAQPPLTWTSASAPLPADADLSQSAAIDDVDCPAAAECVAVGYYTAGATGGDVTEGLAATLSGGTWTPAAFPGVSSKNSAMLDAVACPATGSCVVVGDAQSPVMMPVIETLSDGTWHSGKPALPGDANPAGPAFLNDISCPAAGACVATGWYTNLNGYRVGLLDTLAGGTWTAATAPLPGNAAAEKATDTFADTYLADVACTGAGACVATGQYRDSGGAVQGVIDTLAGGTWKTAQAPLPADAAVSGQVAALWSVSCPAPGTCLAGGHYMNNGGQPRYLIETLANGTWTASTRPLPAAAAANQEWSQKQATTVDGIGCQTVSYCVMPVGYVANGGVVVTQIETLSGGAWTVSSEPLPANAMTGSGQNGFLGLVSCPVPGKCVAGGAYTAKNGSMQGLIVTGTTQHV
jgi:hypothetical protein